MLFPFLCVRVCICLFEHPSFFLSLSVLTLLSEVMLLHLSLGGP